MNLNFIKKTFSKFAEAIIVLCAALIVFLAILFSVARILLPQVPQYRSRVEQWSSHVIHQPIAIGQMQAGWHGLEPIVRLSNVIIYDQSKQKQLIKAQEVDLGIDLLGSLLQWRIEPGDITLSGLNLVIKQDSSGLITINGITVHSANPTTPSDFKFAELQDWLLSQGRIDLDRINITWYGKNGLVVPVNHLKLRLTNAVTGHELDGAAYLQQSDQRMPFRFVLRLDPDELNKTSYQAKLYVKLRNFSLPVWFTKQDLAGFNIISGKADAQFWLESTNLEIQRVQSLFTTDSIVLKSKKTNNNFLIHQLTGNIMWERQDNNWVLAGDKIKLNINDHLWPETKFSLQVNPAQSTQLANQTFQLNFLNISDITPFLLQSSKLSDKTFQLLKQLQLRGQVNNLTLKHSGALQDFSQFSLVTSFNHLSWMHYQNIPGVNNISGAINFTPGSGQVTLQSKDVMLDFGDLFRQPLFLNTLHLTAQLQKTTEGWRVMINHLIARNPTVSIDGVASLLLPNDHSSPILNILAGYNVVNVPSITQFFPVKKLSKGLLAWLDQAIVAGKNVKGSMIFAGPIRAFPFLKQQGRFVVIGKFQDLSLNYHQGWPLLHNMNGQLIFDGNGMNVHADNGKILNTEASNINASIADFHTAVLQVTGNAAGDLSDGIRFLQESPLNAHIGSKLAGFVTTGPMQLNLNLTVKLKQHDNNTHVQGNVKLPGNSLQLPQWWNLSLKQLQGNLQFTEDSLVGNLQGVGLGQTVNVKISTLTPAKQASILQVDLGQLHTNLADLIKQFSLPTFSYAAGALTLHPILQFQGGESPVNVVKIETDLKGVTINLPKPLTKSANDSLPSELDIYFGESKSFKLFAKYADRGSAALTFVKQLAGFHIQSGEVRFGNVGQATWQNQPGLLIDGQLPSLNWDEWKPYLASKAPTNAQTTQTPAELRQIKLTINDFQIFNQDLKTTQLTLDPQQKTWQVNIKSPIIAGDLTIPRNFPLGTVIAKLQYLNLPSDNKDQKNNLTPDDVPNINLSSDSVRYGDKNLGQVQMNLTKQNHRLLINSLHAGNESYDLTASGVWTGTTTASQTSSLTGQLIPKNLGSMLQDWSVTKSLVGGDGSINFNLNWAGPIFSPRLSNLAGTINIKLKNGRIINLSSSTEAELGLGRVLNLFSLQTIPRRLRFDFSDLTDNGFSFDTMAGNFSLANGDATTSDAILNGPVAKIEIKGRIGLAKQDYDVDLYVTPYVTSSLPLVATVAGGPIAGAVTWLAGKIISPAVSHFTTYHYHVTGAWDNPNLEKLSGK